MSWWKCGNPLKVNIPKAEDVKKECKNPINQADLENDICNAVRLIKSTVERYKAGEEGVERHIYHICKTTQDRNYIVGRFIDAGYTINHEGPLGLRLKISW